MIKEAMFYEKFKKDIVRCYLCAHHCKIAPDKLGFCGVRQNIGGNLNSLVYAKAIAANVDPIEKKPLYHFLPGSRSFSIATPGCNFRCGFCQNWQISQKPRSYDFQEGSELMPAAVVEKAEENHCQSISYTYSEPTIFFEYAYDTAKLAKQAGLKNVFVTNGYMSKEALVAINPYLDAANIDLKSFQEKFYLKHCQGHLKPVLDSIKLAKSLGIWIEISTLIIPGENDSSSELADIAQFIANVGEDIPWHISRFHPDYQFINHKLTPIETLKKAETLGREAGLSFVYLGNIRDVS
ncbi:MAG: AmmeMemoRadiSam system radical SAM enzyme [Candidatus Omnitrophota bacterium]